jgi:hypothetical protein
MTQQPVPAINKALSAPVYIFQGAPKPFTFARKAAGVQTSFDASLKCIITPRSGSAFTLTVGAGISLSPVDAMANAKVRIQLSAAQSLLVPIGSYTQFTITEGVAPNQMVVMHGQMIGES